MSQTNLQTTESDELHEMRRDALTVHTRDDHPVQWAMTRENLAIAEEAIADHDATENPRPHLEAALRIHQGRKRGMRGVPSLRQ